MAQDDIRSVANGLQSLYHDGHYAMKFHMKLGPVGGSAEQNTIAFILFVGSAELAYVILEQSFIS